MARLASGGAMPRDRIDLDLHRLELRFADSRLVEPRAVARLAESIERCGQIVPCVVVEAPESQDGEVGGAQALVLIDGYRRVGALRRLGRDTVGVEQWSCDLTAALSRMLARTRDRAFASIEEALLLRTLVGEHGLSQHEVARRSGRDVSWVSRRLQLLSGLPDAALAAVRGGQLSNWAANRVIVPLARANPDHVERLLAMLATTPLSTRELQCWFEHYQQTPRSAREHMVNRPRLFIDTLQATTAWHAGARLRAGPGWPPPGWLRSTRGAPRSCANLIFRRRGSCWWPRCSRPRRPMSGSTPSRRLCSASSPRPRISL